MKQVTAGIIIDGGQVFIARRGPDSSLPGVWEFPGGKFEVGETPEECLKRELHEEFQVEVQVGALYCESANGVINLYKKNSIECDFIR